MKTVNIYLIFDGQCEEAFNLYRSVIGGEFAGISRYKDAPEDPSKPVSPEYRERIMHIVLPISNETMLMGGDGGEGWTDRHITGNNFSVSISTDSKENADEIFNGLSKGGKVNMPMTSTFWGDYFGMLTDKFGVNWMVSHTINS